MSPDDSGSSPALARAVAAAERHVAADGWDQPPRLYALVADDDVRRREPDLARELGVDGDGYTAVEQEGFGVGPGGLEQALAHLMWPPEVAGAAVVHEVLVLPPSAEAQAPQDADDDALARWVAGRPERRDVRLAAGALRDGQGFAVLRLRPADSGTADGGTGDGGTGDDGTGDGGTDSHGTGDDGTGEGGDHEVVQGELVTGPDVAPGLVAALRATLS